MTHVPKTKHASRPDRGFSPLYVGLIPYASQKHRVSLSTSYGCEREGRVGELGFPIDPMYRSCTTSIPPCTVRGRVRRGWRLQGWGRSCARGGVPVPHDSQRAVRTPCNPALRTCGQWPHVQLYWCDLCMSVRLGTDAFAGLGFCREESQAPVASTSSPERMARFCLWEVSSPLDSIGTSAT